jgi:hypothetical protein
MCPTGVAFEMKRSLIISGLLIISLVNMVTNGVLSASYLPSTGGPNGGPQVIGHCHSDSSGDGIAYFHPHPVSEHGSLCVHGQFLDCKSTKVIHYGRTGHEITCLRTTNLPILNQVWLSSPICWSYSSCRDALWHLGVSSGGIPS